jgi:AcrR family transcriptional regulator
LTRPASQEVQTRDQARTQAHERILQAAIKLFGSLGYENTTIRAITGRAGTDTAAVHYHYSDKKLLYRRAVETCVSSLLLKDLSSPVTNVEERDPKAYSALVRILAWEILAPSGQNITQNPHLNDLCRLDRSLLGLRSIIENLMKTTTNS